MLIVYFLIILVTVISSIFNFRQKNVSRQIRRKHGFTSLILGALIDIGLIILCSPYSIESIIIFMLIVVAWIFDIHYNSQARLEVMSHRVKLLTNDKSYRND